MASPLEIRPASREEIAAFIGEWAPMMIEADLAIDDAKIIGMGGFAEKFGRRWVVLDVEPELAAKGFGFQAVRAMRRRLLAAREEIFVQCRGGSAERLLRVLGFQRTDEEMIDLRDGVTRLNIWKWRAAHG